MFSTLSTALNSPGQSHVAQIELVCQQCATKTLCVVRGIAVTNNLTPLGDLRCSSCRSDAVTFTPEDQNKITATMARLNAAKKKLPHSMDAFFRGGDFAWIEESYKDPRQLRAKAEEIVREHPTDATACFRAAAAMYQLRDLRRTAELAEDAKKNAPTSPQPLAFIAEVLWLQDENNAAREAAREAMRHRDGPLLLPADRSAMLKGLARLAAEPSDGRLLGKVGRNEMCPCGSGQKYKKCCGA